MDKAMREALLKILQDENAVEELLNNSRSVNSAIEQNDLMRRQQPVINQNGLRDLNVAKEAGEVYVATDRFVSGVANNVLASEAFTSLVERVAHLEANEKRITELERDNAVLRADVVRLQRDDADKVTERIHNMPANNVRVIDLPHDSFVPSSQARGAQVHADPEKFALAQAQSSLATMMSQLNKKNEGGR